MIYLSSPYYDELKVTRRSRFKHACNAVFVHLKKLENEAVYSPVMFLAEAFESGLLPTPSVIDSDRQVHEDLWPKRWSTQVLRDHATKLYVLDVRGWSKSKGVLQDIREAACKDIPMHLLSKSGSVKDIPEVYLSEVDVEAYRGV